MDLLPKVFRTEGNITEFEPSKIFDSILKETEMSEKDAKHITELVVRRIISSGIKFLSGPHIREIVCSILSEQHYENERKLYTRIGMPLMDYEEILKKESKFELGNIISPERITHWSANQIAEEYAHLRILSNEESKAHLFGDIHINGLCHFSVRPFTQTWDPRLILIGGYPPNESLKGHHIQKSPRDLSSALSQFTKWLRMVQGEFYGNQSLNLITIFLAPYLTNISDETIKKELYKFFSDIDLFPIISGREIPSVSLISSIYIPEFCLKVPAIKPNGLIDSTYEEFEEQCLKLFRALIFILKKISQINGSFSNPHLQIYTNDKFMKAVNNNYLKFWDDLSAFEDISQIKFCFNDLKDKKLSKALSNNIKNFGILQNISLNLPRYAYLSKNEEEFLDLLISKAILSSEILLKKFQTMQERLKLKQLPSCGDLVNENPIFNLENQDLSISLVGLNESAKILTNYELHEHLEAINFSLKVLNELNNICKELSENHGKNFVISENSSINSIERFTKLDLKHFPKDIKLLRKDHGYEYTNSIHFRTNQKIDLSKRVEIQGEFHQLIHRGAIEYISLTNLKENNLTIKEFINNIINKSRISCIGFYP